MIVNTYVHRGISLVQGEGAYLISSAGERYLDLMSNYGVNVLGYAHPELTQALTEQMIKLTTLHGSFSNEVRDQATKTLVQRCGEELAQVYWSNSGAEAIEAALKFAVLTTRKKKFIVCNHGYHGKTLGALSATAGEKYKAPFLPLLWEFTHIPFNDLSALDRALDDQTAAFIVEPIQGEGGIFTPDANYLAEAKVRCAAKQALLIIDEIQTGVGRTGTFLASQNMNVTPDILCLGKGLAGGIPVGATVVTHQVGNSVPKHIHTSTFGGNPLACAGALKTLALLDDALLERVRAHGAYFKERLSDLSSPLVIGVRGQGLMLGVAIKDKRNQLLKALQERKVLAIPAGEDVVRLLPPFVIQTSDIDLAIEAFQTCLDALA